MISSDPCYLSAGEARRCFVDSSLSPVELLEALRLRSATPLVYHERVDDDTDILIQRLLDCAALACDREFDPPRWSPDPRLTEGE